LIGLTTGEETTGTTAAGIPKNRNRLGSVNVRDAVADAYVTVETFGTDTGSTDSFARHDAFAGGETSGWGVVLTWFAAWILEAVTADGASGSMSYCLFLRANGGNERCDRT
jgi:hypothetical protein